MPLAKTASLGLVVLLLAASQPRWARAWAPSRAEAQAAWDRADALAGEGRHDDAVKEYARAWQDLHAPAILYSWAQSERLRGHCTEAAALYERFVTEGQTPPASYDTELLRAQWSNMLANAERQREACQAPTEPATTEPATTEPATTEPATTEPATTEPAPTEPATTEPGTTEPGTGPAATEPGTGPATAPAPWWRDAAGWSLVASGAACLAAGSTLVGVAAWEDGRAEDLATHQRFRDAIDRAIVEERVGLGLLGLGGALAIGGVVRFAVIARRRDRDRTSSLALSPLPRGLALRGRF